MTRAITHEITLREFAQLSKFEDTEVTLWGIHRQQRRKPVLQKNKRHTR